MYDFDSNSNLRVAVIGGGAAGFFAAISTAGLNPSADVVLFESGTKVLRKVKVSGGGRCNFTNLHAGPENFLSQNPHFAKSALSRYTQWDFLDLVARHDIPWHEKTLGQLFCDRSARDIIGMLLSEMRPAELWLRTEIGEIGHDGSRFRVALTREGAPLTVTARNLVVATGGKSIPKMGATGIGYRIAEQFGHALTDTRPGLVPLTFDEARKAAFAALAGTSVPTRVTCNGGSFDEAMLFTHRGLSGPAILQVSSYWHEGQPISLDLTPGKNLFEALKDQRQGDGRKNLSTILAQHLPARLADRIDNLRLEAEKTQLKNLEQAAGPCPDHDNISTDHLYGSSKTASALSSDWQRSATAGRLVYGIPRINGFCDTPASRDHIQGRIRPDWGSTPANNPARSSTPRRESRRRGPASR